jgi:hypothetical protein
VNADVGLIEVTDKTKWTPQVYSIGVVDRLADLSIENISLQLVKARVRAYGCASGELYGRIWALFYRYKSIGGFEYVSDLFIGPRPGLPFQSFPGDSGTLWLLEPPGGPDPDDESDDAKSWANSRAPEPAAKPARRKRAAAWRSGCCPLALQWGGHVSLRRRHGEPVVRARHVPQHRLQPPRGRSRARLGAGASDAGNHRPLPIANIACNIVWCEGQAVLRRQPAEHHDLGDITDAGTSGLSKKDFVPLADVPAWRGDRRLRARARGPTRRSRSLRRHGRAAARRLADAPAVVQEPGEPSSAVVAHAQKFKTPGSKADPATRRAAAFRVWRIFARWWTS